MVVMRDGTLRAFGYNAYGQLGDGTTTDRNAPITLFGGVKAVTCGSYHTIVSMLDGTVRAFGQNDYGQQGDGSTTERNEPITIPNMNIL